MSERRGALLLTRHEDGYVRTQTGENYGTSIPEVSEALQADFVITPEAAEEAAETVFRTGFVLIP